MMRFIIPICLMSGAVLCASCVASKPVHYYTIQPASPAVNQGTQDGLVLLVGNIATPAGLPISSTVTGADLTSRALMNITARRQPGCRHCRVSLLRALRASGKYRTSAGIGQPDRGRLRPAGEDSTSSAKWMARRFRRGGFSCIWN